MKKTILLPLLGAFLAEGLKARAKVAPRQSKATLSTTATSKSSRFNRLIQKIYNEADSNHDGSLSFGETYEMSLKLFANLNREAPIPPPTKEEVLKLYHQADKNKNDSISRDEFQSLATNLAERAFSELLAHKMVTLFGAPLLAELMIRTLAEKEWPPLVAARVIPKQFHEVILPTITTKAFWRTAFLVVFVATLGDLVLHMVAAVFNMSLPAEEAAKSETIRPRRKKATSTRSCKALPAVTPSRKSAWDPLLNKLYEEADTNHDGSLSFDESYQMVLKMIVHLNREAPFDPPSKSKFEKLYRRSDVNRNNSISRDEFTFMAKTMIRRAFWKLATFKLVTLVVAPILAEYLIRLLAGREWLPRLAETIVPERFHERVLPVITSRAFGHTVVLVLLVSTLGNIVMSTVTWILDISFSEEEEKHAGNRKSRRG